MKLILLVESVAADRRRVGQWLEDAGYNLMDCPGPQRADFSCLGVRGRRCALVEIADLAILDSRVLHRASSDDRAATRLVHYYLTSGKPVLVLTDPSTSPLTFENDRIAIADRSSKKAVVTAAKELLDVTCLAS
jgi:hypothetical protein